MRNLVIVAVLVLCFSTLTVAQELPRYEFFGGWSYIRADGGGAVSSPNNGWNLAVTLNINELLAVDIEGSGHYRSYMDEGDAFIFADAPLTLGDGTELLTQEDVLTLPNPMDRGIHDPEIPWTSADVSIIGNVLEVRGTEARNVSSKAHSIAFGPRITFRQDELYQPFYHAMFGIKHTTIDVFQETYPDYYRSPTDEELEEDPTLESVLVLEHDIYDSAITDNILLVFGGGLDIVINEKFSVRPFKLDYVLERQRGEFRPDLSFGAGIVYKIGEKY